MIWSDEKKFNLDGPDGFRVYWRDLRAKPTIFSKRNFGGGTVMVWGAFRDEDPIGLEFISTKMKSDAYQQVLQKHLVPYLHRYPGNNFTFMQDNASIHRSDSTLGWLAARNIDVLKWPACSPDLNPIENLWGMLVRDVYKNNKQYSNVKELQDGIVKAWNNLDGNFLQTLVSSMPSRLFEVGLNQGKVTHY